jgi:malate dehydrogenase (oxaloacetate-decarboxylating)
LMTIDEAREMEVDFDRVAASVDVDIIVVGNGEQILGIGNQGVADVVISIAKLVLYTLCAGIHPNRTLPVVLDCGANNDDLLQDEHYLGLQKPGVRGEEYDAFVDEFVQTARRCFPKAYIHFKGFGVHTARPILDKYSSEIPCFHDDVQRTG